MKIPIVAVIGRPNVGKSSLFNRFLQKRIAVVDEQPGVTRDRNYAVCDWAGREFYLIDTGGIVPDSSDMMEKLITDQSDFAINEADVIMFVVDSHIGIDSVDMKIAKSLKKEKKQCVLVSNKVDNSESGLQIYEFMKLGLGEPIPVSATVGLGVGELLDKLVEALPAEDKNVDVDPDAVRIALIGRPNVGKSSFINKLVGQDRLIVSPIAGTTRDAVDTPFEYNGEQYTLVDTAGLRRKYKVQESVEFYTNLRTDRALDASDVALVLIDATEKVSSQDQRILDKVTSMRRPAVIAVNKWDLIEKDTSTAAEFTRDIQDIITMYSYLPLIYISAKTGQRLGKVISLLKTVHEENHKKISTAELNNFLEKVTNRTHPPAKQGKYIRFYYMTQSEVAPPTFVFFSNFPELVDKAYIKFLSNQIRQEFGFEGVSIRLKFKKR